MHPADVDERGEVGREGEPAGEERGVLDVGARGEHLADVGVGRAGLEVQVIPVVPPGDEPEVAHGRVGGGAGADDDAHVTAQHLQPRGVARLRSLAGGEAHVLPRPEHLGQGRVDAGDVPLVGHDDDAPPAGAEGGPGGLGEGPRPVLIHRPPGGGEPGGARGLARRDP
ncbi:MAG TPA: hypothetical protein DD664_07125 [Janibacter terrae]|nr:hypothetical protein [Janibacter terrae]